MMYIHAYSSRSSWWHKTRLVARPRLLARNKTASKKNPNCNTNDAHRWYQVWYSSDTTAQVYAQHVWYPVPGTRACTLMTTAVNGDISSRQGQQLLLYSWTMHILRHGISYFKKTKQQTINTAVRSRISSKLTSASCCDNRSRVRTTHLRYDGFHVSYGLVQAGYTMYIP